MAWNEPGGNRNDKDPWGNNGNNQGPPDLDEALKQMMKKINGLFGSGPSGGQGGSGGTQSSGGIFGLVILFVVGVLIYQSVYTIDEQQRGVVDRKSVV